MTAMRILFIVPYAPSLIRTRSLNFIKALATRGHHLTVLALAESAQDKINLKKLESNYIKTDSVLLTKSRSVIQCLWRLPLPESLQESYCHCAEMRHLVRGYLTDNNFDCIHVEHLRAVQFLPESKNHLPPIVFDSVDCMTNLYRQFSRYPTVTPRRLINIIEYSKLSKIEPQRLKRFRHIIASSPSDVAALKLIAPHSRITTITNGVDFSYFKPARKTTRQSQIVFSGKMSYFANEQAVLLFLKDILPKIKQVIPKVKFTVAGNAPSFALKRSANDNNIRLTGYTVDIRRFISEAQVAVCPIVVGTGVQNKVLEAMAMGKPVVATSLACNALNTINGTHLLIADNPQDFADNVIALLKDKSQRESLGVQARKYVINFHNWQDKAKELESVYRKVIAENES